MKPKDLIKIVFKMNLIDWDSYNKTRDKEVIRAKQESAYLVKHFFPGLVDEQIAGLIHMRRSNVVYSRRKIKENIELYPSYAKKIQFQIKQLLAIDHSIIDGNEIETKLPLGRTYVKKNEFSYRIVVENSDGEKKEITVSDECYNALINSYNQLNQ